MWWTKLKSISLKFRVSPKPGKWLMQKSSSSRGMSEFLYAMLVSMMAWCTKLSTSDVTEEKASEINAYAPVFQFRQKLLYFDSISLPV